MIVYTGSLDESHDVVQFFRRESRKLRILRRIIVSREKTVVADVNRDGIEFPGLTYDSPALERLFQDLGVICTREILDEGKASPSGVKEFSLGAVWTWGHDSA